MGKKRYISSFVQQLFNKNDKLSCVYTKKKQIVMDYSKGILKRPTVFEMTVTSVINVGRAFFKC